MECPNCKLNEDLKFTRKVVKAGIVRGVQRYYCNHCKTHFSEKRKVKIENKNSHQITILDIANHLGIAPSTVSKALNNKSDINIETKNLIIKLATDLNYKPNHFAKSLSRGNSNTIGVIIPNLERPFFAAVLAGIQSVASKAGYRVIICQSDENHQTEILNIQTLMASRVDGLLISHTKETSTFEHLKIHLNKGVPIVHFDRISNQINSSKITHQNKQGSFQLVKHLIENGCKRIAVLAGPKELLISKDRLDGYLAALKKYNITVDENLIYNSNFQKDETTKVLDFWLSLENPPDAIFTVFYLNAIEMMVEAKKRNIKIPEDIAFVGFGDDLIAELFEPSLTVFHLFPFKMGENAANVLIDNILNQTDYFPQEHQIKGELIIRKSSKK
jgi:LacI family transcriptional regulator